MNLRIVNHLIVNHLIVIHPCMVEQYTEVKMKNEKKRRKRKKEDFQLGGGENSSADMMDLLVQKRIALRSVVFLHSYEKKYKSYIKKQGDDKGKTYLNTLNIANIYLFKFGFCINANNIHMFNLIWESFQG